MISQEFESGGMLVVVGTTKADVLERAEQLMDQGFMISAGHIKQYPIDPNRGRSEFWCSLHKPGTWGGPIGKQP